MSSKTLTSAAFYTSFIAPYKLYYENNVCGYKTITDENLQKILDVEKKYGGPGILLVDNLDVTVNITSSDDLAAIRAAFIAQSSVRPHI